MFGTADVARQGNTDSLCHAFFLQPFQTLTHSCPMQGATMKRVVMQPISQRFFLRPVTGVFETLHRWPLAVFLLDALGCLYSAVICLLFLASDCCIHSQSEPAQDAIRWSPHVLALATSRLFVRRFSGSAAVGTVDAWHRGSCWQPTTQYCLQTKVQHIRQVLFVLSLPSTDLLLWLRDISESEQHCSCVRAIFVNIEK